jgi:tRNA/tmRNA/rRNA uracil-C5-methylase (TrmA/RlmC/RlmD family)
LCREPWIRETIRGKLKELSAHKDYACHKGTACKMRVLDPFCGSGTTCVAAAQNSRHFVGYDTEPEYSDMVLGRLKN